VLKQLLTCPRRYANHAGGRKYDKVTGKELEKSTGHAGQKEKLESSAIFKEMWEKAKADETYLRLKEMFQKEQKEWDKEQKKIKKEEDGEEKEEAKKSGQTRVKKEIKEEDED
jgi:hypothetical protein